MPDPSIDRRGGDRAVLPPGTILQHLYLKDRLRHLPPGRFIEVGVGDGRLSRLLLAAGWRGAGYDLNPESAEKARTLNQAAIAEGTYSVHLGDWLRSPAEHGVDLVLSCMVIEHLDEADEALYLAKARQIIAPGGRLILIVPGSTAHWSVEDEIAGHHRRYDRDTLAERLDAAGWRPDHMAGLTYPVSNLLFPLSEFLVRRAERHLLQRPMAERTRLSGNRDVAFKTRFPAGLGLLLNETTLYPLHLLQRRFRDHPAALVLYAECRR